MLTPGNTSQLVRGLTLTGATALVIGSIIGTGVFFKAAIMSQQVGSPALVLAAWLVAGLLSLAGALTYAELGAMLPHAGGEYLYVRTAYGDAAGFLNGWMRFVVGSAGIAALGVGFATFLSAVAPMPAVWAQRNFHLLGRDVHWQLGLREAVAVAAILLFGATNCAGMTVVHQRISGCPLPHRNGQGSRLSARPSFRRCGPATDGLTCRWWRAR
jgi:APA family basic amino acid/polyamine antiporter